MAKLSEASAKSGTPVTIVVNGRTITARSGQTVQAALFAAGHQVVGKTHKRHEPRGIFCGMGICYDCLVTINGKPNQRACMRIVEDQMEIDIDAS